MLAHNTHASGIFVGRKAYTPTWIARNEKNEQKGSARSACNEFSANKYAFVKNINTVAKVIQTIAMHRSKRDIRA